MDIYQYIKDEEIRYGQEIEVMENWMWCMKEHVRTAIMMKHGKFLKATNDLATKNPKKNIVYSLLNLRYRAEDLDMKDVVVYVDSEQDYHLSFLVKKYHDEVYVAEHDLDTLFDELKEEKIDIGGVLVRKGPDGWVREPMESIAFCDQTDLLSGPIGFKEFFSPDELLETGALGWGDTKNGADTTLDDLVTKADASKTQDDQKPKKTQTPGKYIEVYRLHGSMPSEWLGESDKSVDPAKQKYVRQLQIRAFYKNDKGENVGVCLYRKREYQSSHKLHLPARKLRNRALVMGGVEELIDPQIWTDYSEIRKKDVIDAISKIVRWTNDPTFANKNKVNELDNNEMLVIAEGASMGTLDGGTTQVALFDNWMNEWNVLAQTTAGATDALLGKNQPAGSPFKQTEAIIQQGQGLHTYRQGKFATFVAELYMDPQNGIIRDISKKLTEGTKFLATLSSDELEYVADCMVRNQTEKMKNEYVLSNAGIAPTPEMEQEYAAKVREQFDKKGNKHFIEILKSEFQDKRLAVKVNVGGKQKDLVGIVEKMTNVLRFIFSTYDPQTKTFAALEDPKAMKVFNKLIEYSGMSPFDFGYSTKKPQPQMQPVPAQQPAQMTPAAPAYAS